MVFSRNLNQIRILLLIHLSELIFLKTIGLFSLTNIPLFDHMDPIAGSDIKRDKRKDFPLSNSKDEYLEKLRKVYILRIRELEKILPFALKGWVYKTLLTIKIYYDVMVESIDSMLELLRLIGEDEPFRSRFGIYDDKWIYQRKFLHLGKKLSQNPIIPIMLIIGSDLDLTNSIRNSPSHIEEVFPALITQWAKDIILGVKIELAS
ncbi:hypothetical protein LCGC14_1034550 [marine sediment metagenome]|uniref:Uncharacterized protein n=1 Tax=marine sediment metagenome TaxID=412755 RepID=A0A0F9NF80_9ZZZZ